MPHLVFLPGLIISTPTYPLHDKNYFTILESLKVKIRSARQKAAISVNTQLLELYWEIGNAISQQQKLEGWGTKVVEKLAQDLKMEFPDFKGLSVRNLHNMKSFAEAWPQNPILQPLVAKIPDRSHVLIKMG